MCFHITAQHDGHSTAAAWQGRAGYGTALRTKTDTAQRCSFMPAQHGTARQQLILAWWAHGGLAISAGYQGPHDSMLAHTNLQCRHVCSTFLQCMMQRPLPADRAPLFLPVCMYVSYCSAPVPHWDPVCIPEPTGKAGVCERPCGAGWGAHDMEGVGQTWCVPQHSICDIALPYWLHSASAFWKDKGSYCDMS
jgi:hypothetical protein